MEKGLTAKHDRKNRFMLKRTLDGAGQHRYSFANLALSEELQIPHFLLDRFRIHLMETKYILEEASITNKTIDSKLFFKEKSIFAFSIQHTHESGGDF